MSVPSLSVRVPGGKRPINSSAFASVSIVIDLSLPPQSRGCELTAKKFAKSRSGDTVDVCYLLSVMILTERQPTKKQQQGEQSRELILDATEKLMGTRGYAATSISDIRKACGLPPSSIYWHFGSKDGVLAAVMERGAQRFFAAIPAQVGVEAAAGAMVAASRRSIPTSCGCSFCCRWSAVTIPAVAEVVRRVRDTAIAGFRDAIAQLLPADVPRSKAERVVAELAAVAVALSDGIFLADHLEPDTTDVDRMYRRLYQTLTALIPILLEEK